MPHIFSIAAQMPPPQNSYPNLTCAHYNTPIQTFPTVVIFPYNSVPKPSLSPILEFSLAPNFPDWRNWTVIGAPSFKPYTIHFYTTTCPKTQKNSIRQIPSTNVYTQIQISCTSRPKKSRLKIPSATLPTPSTTHNSKP